LAASFPVCLDWFIDADEELVPFVAPPRCGPASRKCSIKNFQPSHTGYVDQAPSGQTSAIALAGDLISQQARPSVLNAVIVGLGDALLAVVPKTDLAALGDRGAEQLVGRLRSVHALEDYMGKSNCRTELSGCS
jgi:hypothetical protein